MGQIVEITHSKMNPSLKFDVLRVIAEEWMSKMTSHEHVVVMFIWHRTYYWGKTSERIRFKHFLEGIPGVIGPVTFKIGTLRKAIKGLVEKEMITREEDQWGSRYKLNIELENGASGRFRKSKKPRKPNALSKGVKKSAPGVQKSAPGGAKKHTSYKYENNKNENNKYRNSDSRDKSLRPVLSDKIKNRDRELKKKKVSSRVIVPDLRELWMEQVKKTYSEYPCPDWSKKECGQGGHFLKFFRETYPDKDVLEFFLFSIENWSRIGATRLRWMKDIEYPEYPDVGFLFGFKKYFLMAYADDKFHERQIGATQREREIAKFKRMGYTEPQAEKAFEDFRVKSELRRQELLQAEQFERQIIHSKQKEKDLERELKRLKADKGKDVSWDDIKNMNPGSKVRKKAQKRDNDGYGIFEG